MNERDQILLDALDDLKRQAAFVGLCSLTFQTIKKEVLRIMGERDGLREASADLRRLH